MPTFELFPKQDGIDPSDPHSLGNLVKLPLGIHPLTGRRAEIVVAAEQIVPAEAQVVYDILNALPRREPLRKVAEPIPEFILETQRNSTLTSLAGSMRRRGATQSEIEAALLVANDERCRPRLDEEEVRGIAASVARYSPDATAQAATAVHDQSTVTELANARRLVARHGSEIRYCRPWLCWLVWDGKRWRKDETGRIWRRAKDVVRRIYHEAAAAHQDTERERLAKWAVKSETRNQIENMISLAESEPGIAVVPAELDGDLWALNVRNGTIDLRTGQLRPHNPADLFTKLAPVEYDPHAKCPLWDAFLDRVMAGNQELVRYLARIVGLALIAEVLEHALFVFWGKGRNGKGTFVETIISMLGSDYAIQAERQMLMVRQGEVHSTNVADLFGIRFAACIELEKEQRLAEATVKALTGGDRVRARKMHKDFFEFVPSHTVVLSTNHKPIIRGTDPAIWDRVKVFPWTVRIPDEEQDRNLKSKLRAELPGILAWAVRGCLDYQHQGLATPGIVSTATSEYRRDQDVLADFLEEKCEVGEGCWNGSSDLYRAYLTWANENGVSGPNVMTHKGFAEALKERDFTNHRDGKGLSYFRGLAVKSPAVMPAQVPLGGRQRGSWRI